MIVSPIAMLMRPTTAQLRQHPGRRGREDRCTAHVLTAFVEQSGRRRWSPAATGG